MSEPRSVPDEPEEEPSRDARYQRLARQVFSRLLVQQLLHEIAPKSRLIESLDAPPNHYTLGIKVPEEIDKALMILSKRLVDHASTNPAALRSLRLMLRSEVLQQRSGYATGEARATWATEPPPKVVLRG